MRKYMQRSLQQYEVIITSLETKMVVDSYKSNVLVTKKQVMKRYLNKKGYAAVTVEIIKHNFKRRMLVSDFIKYSEEVNNQQFS